MMKRRQDWPTHLFDLIEQRKNMPFKWGVHDCCTFAADAVRAMTGHDLAADVRGYNSAIEAVKIMAEEGGLESMIERRLEEAGCKALVTPRKAQRGDIAAIVTSAQTAVGVCVGRMVAFTGKDGLVYYPLKDCKRAWRIG